MSKSKVYSKDEYKDASELEDETMDDRTEDEDEYRTVNENEDELVTEDEYRTVDENEDELVAEDEYEPVTEDEFVTDDKDELVTEDKDEHVAGEPVAEDEEKDVEEPRDEVEDRTRPKVSIQHGKRDLLNHDHEIKEELLNQLYGITLILKRPNILVIQFVENVMLYFRLNQELLL